MIIKIFTLLRETGAEIPINTRLLFYILLAEEIYGLLGSVPRALQKNGSWFWRDGKGFSVEGGVAVVRGEGRRAGHWFWLEGGGG